VDLYGIVRLCRAAFGRVARARSLCRTSAAGDPLWPNALAVIRSLFPRGIGGRTPSTPSYLRAHSVAKLHALV
jgi:hypothetical protein